MSASLEHKRIAILATDGFEQSELEEPLKALREAGAEVSIVSPGKGPIQGMKHADKGDKFDVDLTLEEARAVDFDALVLPGGLINPDSLRMDRQAVEFVQRCAETGMVIGAICHGPWVLIEAGLVRGLRMTSWPAIESDLLNAGARWTDREVVVDGRFVTSRKPDDLPAFNEALIERIASAQPAVAAMRGS